MSRTRHLSRRTQDVHGTAMSGVLRKCDLFVMRWRCSKQWCHLAVRTEKIIYLIYMRSITLAVQYLWRIGEMFWHNGRSSSTARAPRKRRSWCTTGIPRMFHSRKEFRERTQREMSYGENPDAYEFRMSRHRYVPPVYLQRHEFQTLLREEARHARTFAVPSAVRVSRESALLFALFAPRCLPRRAARELSGATWQRIQPITNAMLIIRVWVVTQREGTQRRCSLQ